MIQLLEAFLPVATWALAAAAGLVFLIRFPGAVREARARLEREAGETRPAAPAAAVLPSAPIAAEVAPRPAAIEAPAEPEPEPEPVAVAVAPRERRKPDWLGSLRKSRSALVDKIDAALRGHSQLDTEILEEVEAILFGADIGVRTADDLLEAVRAAGSPDAVHRALAARALEILGALPSARVEMGTRPHVVMVVGVNGSGKTTSIGKLAARWAGEGKRVVLAAADTYRAAAIDQLAVWAERTGARLVRGEPGSDPAAVAFDALRSAVADDADVVVIDTAGRLQTDQGLMDQLAKVARVVAKELPDAPHETLLVVDGNTGQNAIRQAQEFSRAVAVTGIVLTKLDGTAKGGVVLGIAQEVGIPVRYVGMGESLEDLHDFAAPDFVAALFAAGADA